MKRPTRVDVAERAGVSVATVSYVINDGPRPVSDETRQRVLTAIDELKYRPHAVARSLRTGSTNTVGLLVQSLLHPYVSQLVTAVEDYLAREDYALILASSHEDRAREQHLLQLLSAQAIDGLLYVPVSHHNGQEVERLIEREVPVVFLDRYIPGLTADAVMTDNVAAAREVTRYLLDQGARHVICVSFSEEASSALDRVEGYRQAMAERGLLVDDEAVLVVHYALGDRAADLLHSYAEKHGWPDGIFCTTDDALIDSVKVLNQQGISVPEQTCVAGGFSDSPWNQLLDPPLPIVKQDYEQVAARAVKFLMDRMDGNKEAPRIELIPAHFDLQLY